jgi:hypothetical protein
MTLTVLRRDTQDIVWQLAHESFRPVMLPQSAMEIRIEQITAEPFRQEEPESVATVSRTALRYGEAPPGMTQFIPIDGEPPQLESGVSYIIAVREQPDGESRRFTLRVA